MIITWYGQACLRIETAGVSIFIDPFAKEIGLTPPRAKTDIVFITHEHYDHNNREPFGDAFIIDSPGEYDIKGIAAKGISSFHDATRGSERGLNTIYRIEAEGIVLVHMGDFGEPQLRNEQLEAMGAVDILAIPVGGVYTIDGAAAAKITNQAEPKIVIPIHYAIPRLAVKLNPVDDFLSEIGQKPQPQPRLTVKKKDIGEEETRVVVLTPPSASA